TLEGVEGKLFRPMALTVVFALVGSMLLSVTLMPALASLVLRKKVRGRSAQGHTDDTEPKPSHHGEPWLVRVLQRAYRPLLAGALQWRWLVLGLTALVVANAAFLATRLGTEFVPRLREMAVVINTVRLA